MYLAWCISLLDDAGLHFSCLVFICLLADVLHVDLPLLSFLAGAKKGLTSFKYDSVSNRIAIVLCKRSGLSMACLPT